MEKQNKIKNKQIVEDNFNGITLIALVVTIIVLMIISGITVATLMGENGIIKRARDAKINTENARIKERIQLAYHSALTGGQGNYTKDTLEEELTKEFGDDFEEVDDSNATSWILKAGGQSVTIPAGKKVEEKVVGSSSDWKLNEAKDTIIAYIGENITGDTFVIPNYVDDNKIITIGNGSAPIWTEKFSNPNDFMSGKKLKITEGIQNIKYNAFVASSGLVGDLILPESIKNIEGYAFAGCTNLNGKLYIGKNAESIGISAFGGFTTNNVEIHMKNIPEVFSGYGSFNGTLTLGEEVETIADETFMDMRIHRKFGFA